MSKANWFVAVLLPGLLSVAHLAAAETITVFAAASLKDALDENAKAYQANAGDKVVASYAASSALAKQIEAGAPADVFISADLDWMDYLQQRNLIKVETRQNLLRNRLVLIAPADSKVTVNIAPGFPLANLLETGRLAMANPDSVPAGKYGKASLEALGVWKDVQSKIAAADNVRAALVLVSRGEAPLGIVYRTDAMADKGVKVVDTFPPGSYPSIVYPAALLAVSKSAAAKSLLDYLRSPPARPVWEKYGFGVIQ